MIIALSNQPNDFNQSTNQSTKSPPCILQGGLFDLIPFDTKLQ